MNLIKTMFFTAAMLTVAATAQENLLKDGLKGWTLSNSRKIAVDRTEKVTETGSLRLTNGATAIRTVKLEPDGVYELSFSMKGKEVSAEKDQGSWITAHCKNVRKWFRITIDPNNAPETGTFDWKKGTYRLDPAVLGGTELLLEFRLVGTGTVWFDNIMLKKLKIYKLPSEWGRVNPKQVFADSEVKMSAEYSIRLETAKKTQIQIQKEVELEPGVEYELTYYLKGKELSSGPKQGACLLVCGAHRKRWVIVPVDGKKSWQTGTFDWKRGTFKFTSKLFDNDKILILPTLSGTGTAWFDKIEVKKVKDVSTSSFRKMYDRNIPEAAFHPMGVSGFFLPDEPVRFQLEAAGTGKAAYTVRLKDFSGKTSAIIRKGELVLPGKTEIEFPPQKRGYYVAEAEISVNGKKACFLQCGAVSAPEAKRRDPFFQLGYGVYPELHDAYKRAGVGLIALKLKANDHLSRVKTDINTIIESQLKYYAPFLNSGDFVLDLTIGTTLRKNPDPKAVAEGRGSLNDELLNHISQGIRLMAEQTKGKIKEWNVGSEISSDATIAARYSGTWSEALFNNMIITRIASRIAKQVDPEIKIYCGGNSDHNCTYPYYDILFKDLHKEVDGYFIDAYTGNWDMTLGGHSIPEKSLRSFYEASSGLAAKYGKDPRIKNGETGYAIHYGAAFDHGISVEQAALTARTIILTKAARVKCFELHMPTFHSGLRDMKDNTSFMTTIWKPVMYQKKIYELPLPGGAMYATAARELAFAEIRKELTVGSNYACIFTRPDGKTVAAVWNIEAPLELKIDLKNDTQLIDMVGSETSLKKGSHTLNASPEPVYLVTAESPESIAEALSQAFGAATPGLKFAAKRHDQNTISLFIRNPGVKPVAAELTGDGKKLQPISVLPGKINTFRIPLCRQLAILCNGKTYAVQPDLSCLSVQPVRTRPVFDGSGKWLAGLKKKELRYPDDIYPKSALQPELCYFKTKDFNPNGHNISADYYLAYDAENFYLAVKVDDPIHFQKAENGYLWEGDSIQWVISAADVPPKEVRSGRSEQKIYSDLNFGLALTAKGPEYRRYLGKTGILKYPCNVSRKGNITFYEVAIPWSELGVKPDPGKALRFSMVVCDKNSEATKGCPYYLAVTPGVVRGMDAGEYRLMIFEKE